MYMYVCDYDKNMHRRDVIYTTALWYKANSTCVIFTNSKKLHRACVYYCTPFTQYYMYMYTVHDDCVHTAHLLIMPQ